MRASFEMAAHARHHHRRRDRPVDEVDGAQRESALFLLGTLQAGEENHRTVVQPRYLLQPAAEFEAAHPRHQDIGQDEVGSPAPHEVAQPLVSVDRRLHRILLRQQVLHDEELLGRVIHHQDRRLTLVHQSPSPFTGASLSRTR